MTVHIPRWVVFAVGACLIALVAFLVGRGSGGDGEIDTQPPERSQAESKQPVEQTRVPVLGDKAFAEPNGHGFGSAHPRSIYNGGDASGLVEDISWQDWGETVTYGTGLGSQFRPAGGYYEKPVQVRLQARKLDDCGESDSPAYTLLLAQLQERPGGPFGDWFRWSGAGAICQPAF